MNGIYRLFVLTGHVVKRNKNLILPCVVTLSGGLPLSRGAQLEGRLRCHLERHTGNAALLSGLRRAASSDLSILDSLSFSFASLLSFFFFRPQSPTSLLLQTLRGTDRLEEAQPAPFCVGTLLTHQSGEEAGRGAQNPNQKPYIYIEFVEFKNVPLKQNAAGPL